MLFHKIHTEDLKKNAAQLILGDLTTPVRDFLETLNKKAKALSITSEGTIGACMYKAVSYPSDAKKQKVDTKVTFKPPILPFPKNKSNCLNMSIYNQMKAWYNLVTIPEENRTREQKHKIQTFKLNLPNNRNNNREKNAACKEKFEEREAMTVATEQQTHHPPQFHDPHYHHQSYDDKPYVHHHDSHH